jgi:phosphatidylserine/phosphatidylglycerophosphate/cardiolipin synthase-like enzyme
MADFITFKSGNYEVPPDNPFAVTFASARDIIYPFDGTAVISPPDLKDEDWGTAVSRWPFHSLSFPKPWSSGDKKIFPLLRDMLNVPVRFNKCLHIIFIANDGVYGSGAMSEFACSQLSSTPKYIVVELSDITTLEIEDPPKPLTKKAGVSLVDRIGEDPTISSIKTAYFDSTNVPGTITAYDAAGLKIDANAALLALGVSTGVTPELNSCLVQCVFPNGDPADIRNCSLADAVLVVGHDNSLARVPVREGKVTVQDKSTRWYTSWPQGHFKKQDLAVEELATEFLTADATTGEKVHFLRICVFDPYREFQTKVPEEVSRGKFEFSPNRFKVFSQNNRVTLLNNGQRFFADLIKTGETLKADDHMLLCNWRMHPHVPLKGCLSLYNVGFCNDGLDAVQTAISNLFDAGFCVSIRLSPVKKTDFIGILGVDETGSAEIWNSLLDNGYIDANGNISATFNPESDPSFNLTIDPAHEAVKGPIVDVLKRLRAKGNDTSQHFIFSPEENAAFSGRLEIKGKSAYLRAGTRCFLPLTNPYTSPTEPTDVRAAWKNDTGSANTVSVQKEAFDSTVIPVINESSTAIGILQPPWFRMEIDTQDPPQAVIRRMAAAGDIRSAVGADDSADIRVLMINLVSGIHAVTALEDETSAVPSMTALDTLAVALLNVPEGQEALADADQFITPFVSFGFEAHDIAAAAVPYQPEELGGFLRSRIAAGVKVKAMLWDQMLERLKPATETEAGDTNNLAAASCINKMIDGRLGGCVIDRSSRAFSAFHQKASVLVRHEGGGKHAITAYIGGIDSTMGRWDTDNHFAYDPDRPGGPWHDVHVRLEGQCTLDIIRNFKQRWDALRYFMQNNVVTHTPVVYNTVFETERVEDDLLNPFNVADINPNAFVQINRTIPPKCKHADVVSVSGAAPDETYPYVTSAGEMAAKASYLNAIKTARRFIHIEDQYFWDTEIALALHEALEKEKGPAFLILVLPKNLGEFEMIDDLLYKRRLVAINVLKHGAKAPRGSNPSYDIQPKQAGEEEYADLSSKIAIVSPVTDSGSDVYVHSKHMIVDDVWMTIGSSNIGYRSMSYDFEIDAAIVGQELYNGGTGVVRAQRMELWRRHLNLPLALSSLLSDPYSGFRMFKHLEDSSSTVPDYGIGPYKSVRSKKLDATDVPSIGEGKSAITFGENSLEFFWLMNNVFDPDGRTAAENTLLKNIIKYPPIYFEKLQMEFRDSNSSGWMATVHTEIEGGMEYRVRVTVAVSDTEESTSTPEEYCTMPLTMSGYSAIAIQGASFIFVPREFQAEVRAELQRRAAAADPWAELSISGNVTVGNSESTDLIINKTLFIDQ